MITLNYAQCVYCGGELKKAFGDPDNYSNIVRTADGRQTKVYGTYPAQCITCGKINRVADSLKVHN